MSEKGQSRKSMFVAKNMEELRRLYDSDTPVLAYAFKRQPALTLPGRGCVRLSAHATQIYLMSLRP
jgi:hypothetical protein